MLPALFLAATTAELYICKVFENPKQLSLHNRNKLIPKIMMVGSTSQPSV